MVRGADDLNNEELKVVSEFNVKELRYKYLVSLKNSCEQKLASIKSNVYSLNGLKITSENSDINTGVFGIDLGIEYQPFDESGDKTEIKDDICACIANEGGKTVLIGEPGCGKSVSLLKLTVDFASKALNDDELPLPILIPLGGYKNSSNIEDFIKLCMGKQYSLLFSRDCIFLFDALNEVASAKRAEVIDYVKGCKKYIVSCRALDYKREFFDEQKLSRIEILELDLIQIQNAIFSMSSQEEQKEKFWKEIGGGDQLISFWNILHGNEERNKIFWTSPNSINLNTLNTLKEISNTYQYNAWENMHAKGLLPLCRNPMMLRMLYELYLRQSTTLPSNKGLLFQKFALNCIDQEIKKRARIDGKVVDNYEPLKQKTLKGLTFLAKCIIEHKEGTGLERAEGRRLLIEEFESEDNVNEIEKFAQDANILEIDNCYKFPHQLHQEYFASRYLQQAFDSRAPAAHFFKEVEWWEPVGWEEVAVILIGILNNHDINDFLIWLSEAQPQLVIRCVENAGVPSLSLATLNNDIRHKLFDIWLDRINGSKDTIKSKIYIGQALDKIGDYRSGVGVITGTETPDIKWIDANNGSLKISKYPITVIQFSAFVNANDGYCDDSNWDFMSKYERPNLKSLNLPSLGNGPMVKVSWYEAMAFCKWYSRKVGKKIRLPNEAEWIENIYTKDESNYITESDLSNLEDENKIVSVGLFRLYRKDKIEDVGLIWEWCLDSLENETESLECRLVTGILKGGSWRYSLEYRKKNYKFLTYPSYSNIDIGFRIVQEN